MSITSLRRLRRLAALGTATLLALPAFVVGDAGATASFTFTRLSGSDRYATAAAISRDSFTSANVAVVASGADFPDALAGGYLAGTRSAPVLLTRPDDVPNATASALSRLGVQRIFLLGGERAVSAAVEEELSENYTVTRVRGDDRFETARRVAITGGTVGTLSGDKTVVITNGNRFADALAAGPIAYGKKFPILLTEASKLSQHAAAAVEELGATRAIVVGGTSVVSDQVRKDLEAQGVTVERIEGTDREETAAAVADFAVDRLAFSTTHVELARADDFADGLTGGPHGGKALAPVLLTNPGTLSSPARSYLARHSDTLSAGHIFGGTAAVSDDVKSAAEDAARQVSGEVVRTDHGNNLYVYVREGEDRATPVSYSDHDEFFVNGQPATVGAFESVLDAGDQMHFVSGSPRRHELTNIPDREINGRTVGNIDTSNSDTDPGRSNIFGFISDVTGDELRALRYDVDGASFSIDGTAADMTDFENDINEGDVVTITGEGTETTHFALRNRKLTGVAFVLSKSTSTTGARTVTFRVDVYGDIPTASSRPGGATADSPNNDDRFSATSADTFLGDAVNIEQFYDQVTNGDLITFERYGDEEYWTLDNQPLPTVEGIAQSIDRNGDDDAFNNNNSDGGSMTLRLPDASVRTYDYVHDPSSFFVDGKLSTEAEFESAFSDGDEIVYRPHDPDAGQSQRIELTNK